MALVLGHDNPNARCPQPGMQPLPLQPWNFCGWKWTALCQVSVPEAAAHNAPTNCAIYSAMILDEQ